MKVQNFSITYNVKRLCCRCGILTKNIIEMVKIELEEWQVKNLREYFGHNDKTQTEHWAYDVFNKAYKEQCNIADVVGQSEQLKCRCIKDPLGSGPVLKCCDECAKSNKF